jgi:hypothetical protein
MGNKIKNNNKKNNFRQGKIFYYQIVDYFKKIDRGGRRDLTKENIEV